jgi:hypothetical protein
VVEDVIALLGAGRKSDEMRAKSIWLCSRMWRRAAPMVPDDSGVEPWWSRWRWARR